MSSPVYPAKHSISPQYARLDGSTFTLSSVQLLGLGLTGIVLRHGDYAIKIPRLQVTADLSDEAKYFAECDNEMNLDAIEQEKIAYERLGTHSGIVPCIQLSSEGITMKYLERGPLDRYIKNYRPVVDDRKADWLRSLANTLCYIHGRGVVLYDIALRNVLVDDDLSLRLIDFGQASVIPLEHEASEVVVREQSRSSNVLQSSTALEGRALEDRLDHMAVLIDIFHFAFVGYSIAIWKKHEYKLFHASPGLSSNQGSQQSLPPKWPDIEELPSLENILCGNILRKCWAREYLSMTQVRDDLYSALRL